MDDRLDTDQGVGPSRVHGRCSCEEGSPRGGALRSLSRFSWRRPGWKTFGQISAPVAAFLFVYVAALAALLIQGFWTTDSFTGKVVHSWNLDNFREIANAPYPTIILRTLAIASAVTVTCMLLAFPYAYFLVRIAGRRLRIALLVATVLPLWVSYLVRVYSWRLILNPDGALNWVLNGLGLPDLNIAYTNWAMWLVFTYIWFPFMVLPVYAALERVPTRCSRRRPISAARGCDDAAAGDPAAGGSGARRRLDLHVLAHARRLHRPSLVGGPGSSLIGTVVYDNLGLANNAPFAAAFAMVPLGIMALYLVLMKRLGAFESL